MPELTFLAGDDIKKLEGWYIVGAAWLPTGPQPGISLILSHPAAEKYAKLTLFAHAKMNINGTGTAVKIEVLPQFSIRSSDSE